MKPRNRVLMIFLSVMILLFLLNHAPASAVTCEKIYSGNYYWYECGGIRVTQEVHKDDRNQITEFQVVGDRAVWRYGYEISGSTNAWDYAYYSNSVYGGTITQISQSAVGGGLTDPKITNFLITGERAVWRYGHDVSGSTTSWNYAYYSNSIYSGSIVQVTQYASGGSLCNPRIQYFMITTERPNRATWRYGYDVSGSTTCRDYAYHDSCLTGDTTEQITQTASGNYNINSFSVSGDTATWQYCYYSSCNPYSSTLRNCGVCGPCTPAAEVCDDEDNDCDCMIDEGCDDDNDNYCDSSMSVVGTPSTCTAGGGDCADTDNTVNPGASEVCDYKDNDCDGLIDEGVKNICGSCGLVPEEICDSIDNDCDKLIDEGFDQDCDGFTTCGGDCNDNNPNIHPGVPEICNGIDDNCDGNIDETNYSDTLRFTWTIIGTGTEIWGSYQYKYSSSICYWCFGSDEWICPSQTEWEIIDKIRLPFPNANEDYGCCCPTGLYDSYPGVVDKCDDTTAFYCKYRKNVLSDSSQRTKSDSDSGFVLLGIGPKDMGTFDATPVAEMGGIVVNITYSVNSNNREVRVWLDNSHVFACVDYDLDGSCDASTPEPSKCGTDVGECVSGEMMCSNSSWMCGGSYQGPSVEVCDGLDNDCDGIVDNGVRNACGGCGPVPDEVCDGLDNNCNGLIDDGLTGCDLDSDGVPNAADNCMDIANSDQRNSDTKFMDTGSIDENASYVPGEILIKMKEGVSIASYSTGALNSKNGMIYNKNIDLGGYFGLKNVYKLTFPKNVNIKKLIEEYRNDPNVEMAEPNYIYHVTDTPNDIYFSRQWAHRNIMSEKAWAMEKGNSDVIIAIVDTGVDYTHPDLAGKIYSKGRDFYSNDYDAMDENGHGTHCAGIAAGDTNNVIGIAGTCWNCKILPVRFLGPNGYGTSDAAASAIIYAADNGADIISNSWGSTGGSSLIHSALEYAHSKGVVIVAAAGNNGNAGPFYPAAYDNVISVAATDAGDSRAYFSNYGSWVDVSAPGVGILSTYPYGYATLSGTSMAAPFVAGLAGLMMSKNPSLTAEQIEQIIESSADRINPDYPIGAGRINSFNALLSVASISESFVWNVTGRGIEIWWECPTEKTAVRYATDSGSSSVSLVDRIKNIGRFHAEPSPQMGGVVFNVSYSVIDSNEKVMTWVDGDQIYSCLDFNKDVECDYLSELAEELPGSYLVSNSEKGDVCDMCPADASDNCDVDYAGAGSIGSSGGTVSNRKNTLNIIVAPNAVGIQTSFAITPGDIPQFNEIALLRPVGYAYRLTPENIRFNRSVAVRISYGNYNITNNAGIVSFDGKNWAAEYSLLSDNQTVITNVTYLSTFVVANVVKGDVDINCIVNVLDLARVGMSFGRNISSSNRGSDINKDSAINVLDLATVGKNFGRSC